jgi:hypothetical protein
MFYLRWAFTSRPLQTILAAGALVVDSDPHRVLDGNLRHR